MNERSLRQEKERRERCASIAKTMLEEPSKGLQVAVVAETLFRLGERLHELNDALGTAWTILANVSEGDWSKQTEEWQEAVVRWRDEDFHPLFVGEPEEPTT